MLIISGQLKVMRETLYLRNLNPNIKIKLGNLWTQESLREDIYCLTRSFTNLIFNRNEIDDTLRARFHSFISNVKELCLNYYRHLKLVGFTRLPFDVLEGCEGPLHWTYLDNYLNNEVVTLFEGFLVGLSNTDEDIAKICDWLNKILEYYSEYQLEGYLHIEDGHIDREIFIVDSTFEVFY